MEKYVRQKARSAINEIRWIKDAVSMIDEGYFKEQNGKLVRMKDYDFDNEKLFEFLHYRLNDLIKQLKELKIGLRTKDVESIRQLKSDLWCGCSVEYQQNFMNNCKAYTY